MSSAASCRSGVWLSFGSLCYVPTDQQPINLVEQHLVCVMVQCVWSVQHLNAARACKTMRGGGGGGHMQGHSPAAMCCCCVAVNQAVCG